MHSSWNQCRQLYGKWLSSPLDVLQLFHVLNSCISAAESETQRGQKHLRQVLGQKDQRGCGHKNSSENKRQTQQTVYHNLQMKFNSKWLTLGMTLLVIKLLKCKKYYSKEVLSWLCLKTSFEGLIYEMHNNMDLYILFFIYLDCPYFMKIWESW